MRSPGNAAAGCALRNVAIATTAKNAMNRFIFSLPSLYRLDRHRAARIRVHSQKISILRPPHPCPLLEPAFAKLRRGRRRGEGVELRARSVAPSHFLILSQTHSLPSLALRVLLSQRERRRGLLARAGTQRRR